MGRSRRRTPKHEPPVERPEPTTHVEKMDHHPFAAALRGVTAAPPKRAPKAPASRAPAPKAAASPSRSARAEGGISRHAYDDRMAFREAYAGVRPLAERSGARHSPKKRAPKERVEPPKRVEADEEVRRRLDALVSGGFQFEVRRHEDGGVTGRRKDAHLSNVASLSEGFVPQATLDLHGMTAEVAARAVVSFVRESLRLGKRNVLVIHGRGHGSAGGVGVLGDAVVDALTESGASSSVLAFASAPRVLGGVGALAIRLGER
jgi:DNA-nicking Smr family endonuclease